MNTHEINLLSRLQECAREVNLSLVCFEHSIVYQTLEFDYLPVAYSKGTLEFELAYDSSVVGSLNVVVMAKKQPVGYWPLLISMKNGRVCVTNSGGALLVPLAVAYASEKGRKLLAEFTLNSLQALQRDERFSDHALVEVFSGNSQSGLSHLHELAPDYFVSCSVRPELFVDLTIGFDAYWGHVRRSYRPLISSAEKLWSAEIDRVGEGENFSDFRVLHTKAAGKQTRNDQTWDIHQEMLKNGEAFLVCLRDNNRNLVGGAFFPITTDEAVYSTAAYDRDQFDKPIGHLAQILAIKEFMSRGIRHYKLGEIPVPDGLGEVPQKNKNIALFKRGFASVIRPRFVFS